MLYYIILYTAMHQNGIKFASEMQRIGLKDKNPYGMFRFGWSYANNSIDLEDSYVVMIVFFPGSINKIMNEATYLLTIMYISMYPMCVACEIVKMGIDQESIEKDRFEMVHSNE